MAGTNSLEIEIFNLFQENPSADYVCSELVAKYERSEAISPQEVEGLSHFLMLQGRFDLLQNFYIKAVIQKKVSRLPVGYIFNCLIENNILIDEEAISFIETLIQNQKDDSTIAQSKSLLEYLPELHLSTEKSKEAFLAEQKNLKEQLIEQLGKHRLYQMTEQEEATLKQLAKLFPQDIEVGILQQAHLEKKADDILKKYTSHSQLEKLKPYQALTNQAPEVSDKIDFLKEGISKLSDTLALEAPDQLYNLAILCFQLELHDLSIDILAKAPETKARNWLKAEALNASGRFLDLLKLLEELDASPDLEAEDSYGSTYLKALAYYGLGQKDLAIRLMSSLAQSVPFYRSSEAFLHEWTNS